MKRPNTCVNLIKAINQIDKSGDPVRFSRAMANVIVGQILPDGVVKGGIFRPISRRRLRSCLSRALMRCE